MRLVRAPGVAGLRHSLFDLLIEPVDSLRSVERHKARLLASLLLCLLMFGFTSGIVQVALIPGFQSTFSAMVAALLVVLCAYLGSRTRFYRLSAAFAVLAPALACVVVAVHNPNDRAWYGFILIAVIVAALFFSVRVAALVAVVVFTTLCLLPIWVVELRAPERILPLLALHGVLSPLLLIAARHQALIEREGQGELRKMDARLAEVQQLEAVARTAGTTAHDLNNLITVIDANATLLQQGGPSTSVELAEIRTAVGRAAALSRNLLSSSRTEALAARPFNVFEALQDFLPILARLAGPSIEIIVSGSRSAGQVSMSSLRLEQVLMNLIANARDAMPRGGRIVIDCVAVSSDHADLAHRSGKTPDGYVALTVTDTGAGMAPATLERAFEPFFTTKPTGRGTGLGLAIIREIVEQSGGHLVVTSELGVGSTFRAYLPAHGSGSST